MTTTGGKEGLQLKADARSADERKIGDQPDISRIVCRSCRQHHMQRSGQCVSLLQEPDAANPHVRFDERGVETGAWRS